MATIPGLYFSSANEENERTIDLYSFKGTFSIPEAHAYGNCRRRNTYQEIGRIRKGQFGQIFKCKDKRTKEKFSLKKYITSIDHDGGIPAYILREIKVLSVLKHNNIEMMVGTVADKDLNSTCLILEFCPVSLSDLMTWNSESLHEKHIIKGIMEQLFEGLRYIHENTVIHRNLNPDNILFDETGNLKISGFSDSRFYTAGNMTPQVCKVQYRAPELLLQSKQYSYAVDLWSAGCIFAHLLLKKPVFIGSCEIEVWKSICGILGTPNDSLWPDFSKLASGLSGDYMQTEFKNTLMTLFGGHTGTTVLLVCKLLIYNPTLRLLAKDCLKQFYFVEAPNPATVKHIASIFKKKESSES